MITYITTPTTVYYENPCPNKSFNEMYYYLKAKGIKNNKFFLLIYDPGLIGVDPRDPNLDLVTKNRIARECTINFW